MTNVRDGAPDVSGLDTLTLEIVLTHPPSDDLHAAVYDCLGVVPDVKGPGRQIELVDVIVAYLGVATMEVLRDRLGNAALDRLLRLARLLLHQGQSNPGTPRVKHDGELRLVVGARQGVTFILDHSVADDSRAIAAMLEVKVVEHIDGTTLRWHPDLGRWLAEPPHHERRGQSRRQGGRGLWGA